MASDGTATVSTSQHASRNERRPAKRVVVTGTGFSSQEREVVKEWVVELGLQYSGDLVCKFSTHLVCKDLLAAFNETKYVKAVHWGITIVSFRWIYDCLLARRLLPTAGYNSDSPGPADAALREGVQLLRKRQEELSRQGAPGSPLQQEEQLSWDHQQEGLHEPPTCLGPSNTDPYAALLNDETGEALRCSDTVANNKECPEGRHQQEAAAQDDFTFDMPCGSRALPISPAFCSAGGVMSQVKSLGAGTASGSQLSAAGSKDGAAQSTAAQGIRDPQVGASASARADHAAADAADCTAQQQLLSPPDRNLTHPSGRQLPTPGTVDISLSQLKAEIILVTSVPEKDSAARIAGVVDGDDGSPLDARVRPTRLHLVPDCAGPPHRLTAGREQPLTADAADRGWCSPATGVSTERVGVVSEDINLLPPCSGVERDGAMNTAVGEEAPKPAATWQHGSEAGVLYSGFRCMPLSPLNKTAKGRRLVRTDRMSMAVHGVAADGELAAAQSNLENGLEDDLEDDLSDALPKVADVPLKPQVRQQQRQQQRQLGPSLEQRTAKPASEGSAVLADAGPVRIKPEVDCKAIRTGPILAQAPDGEGLAAAATAGGAAGGKLSARRRAAALATNSLVSEPEPMVMASRPAGARAAAAAAAPARVSRKQLGRKGDGYETDSASTSSGGAVVSNSEGPDIFGGPSPNFDILARGPLTGFTSSLAQGKGYPPRPSSRHCDVETPETIPESDLDDEGPGAAADPIRGQQPCRYGRARCQARNSSAEKPLPQAGAHKAGHQHVEEATDTSPYIDTGYALEAGDSDKDRLQRPGTGTGTGAGALFAVDFPRGAREVEPGPSAKARTSLVSELSQSSSQSMSHPQSASPQQLVEGLLQWPQEPLTDEKSINQYLELQVTAAEEYLATECPSSTGGLLSDGHVRVVKSIRRTKAQTVSERHPGVMLKAVQFAEQVSVDPLGLVLHCRDRNKRARCPIIALGSDSDGDVPDAATSREIFLAELCNIYLLPNGEWWLEYRRYYSINDLTALAEVTGQRPNLPNDFNGRREVVCDVDVSHCRIIHVRGNLQMTRTKKANPPGERGRAAGTGGPVFCRFTYNKHTGALTSLSQQVADLVID